MKVPSIMEFRKEVAVREREKGKKSILREVKFIQTKIFITYFYL